MRGNLYDLHLQSLSYFFHILQICVATCLIIYKRAARKQRVMKIPSSPSTQIFSAQKLLPTKINACDTAPNIIVLILITDLMLNDWHKRVCILQLLQTICATITKAKEVNIFTAAQINALSIYEI